MPEPTIEIGVVRSARPGRREIRVRARPGCMSQFDGMAWLRLRLPDGVELRCKVDAVACGPGDVRVTLGAGVPRDTVAQMKGAIVVVAAHERVKRDVRDYETRELIGFRVRQNAGAWLGSVVNAYDTGAHGVIEIERSGGSVVLLPVVDEAIAHIDFEQRVIDVNDVTRFAVENGRPCPSEDGDEN